MTDTEYRVHRIIANMGSGNAEVEATSTLDDLGFDSLDCVELAVKIADEFDFDPHWIIEDFEPRDTVGKVSAAVEKARPTP